MGYTEIFHLCNLRFADDLLLISTSLRKLKTMLGDIIHAARIRGLELHPHKTNILSNVEHRKGIETAKYAKVAEMDIEIFPISASVKYLGRRVCF